MRFALIKKNIVINVIIAEQDFIDENSKNLDCDECVFLKDDVIADIGGSYIDGIFSEPESQEPELSIEEHFKVLEEQIAELKK